MNSILANFLIGAVVSLVALILGASFWQSILVAAGVSLVLALSKEAKS